MERSAVFANSHADSIPFGVFSAVPSGLLNLVKSTQDCVLGYFQPSLRDGSETVKAATKTRDRRKWGESMET